MPGKGIRLAMEFLPLRLFYSIPSIIWLCTNYTIHICKFWKPVYDIIHTLFIHFAISGYLIKIVLLKNENPYVRYYYIGLAATKFCLPKSLQVGKNRTYCTKKNRNYSSFKYLYLFLYSYFCIFFSEFFFFFS